MLGIISFSSKNEPRDTRAKTETRRNNEEQTDLTILINQDSTNFIIYALRFILYYTAFNSFMSLTITFPFTKITTSQP